MPDLIDESMEYSVEILSAKSSFHAHHVLTSDDSDVSTLNADLDSLPAGISVRRIQTTFLAKLSLPLVTTVPSTVTIPSTRAASSVIFEIVTSSIMV